jgi:preprotein translocase subunit SecE
MAESNSLVQKVRHWPGGVKNYVQDLQMEMKRVTWPSRKQVQATTVVVIATVFGFAAYFAVVDTIFTRTIGKLFEAFTAQ